ncbi:MAG TPA: GNAT family N-acetyltransferase [Acidimicrobiales bacterium]|nr:GNAT family N-acetyltransferase [Acidimicrobiales bacterium]
MGSVGVHVSYLSAGEEAEWISAVQASTALHRPWLAPPDTSEGFRAYLERSRRDDQATWVIRHAECGGLAGYASVNNIVRRALQSGYLGYGAFAAHAGQGLMTEGLGLVLDDVFGPLGLHRVEANIQPGNARSIALVRRLGFAKEGYSPRYLLVDGDWRDHERWALRAEEWTRG